MFDIFGGWLLSTVYQTCQAAGLGYSASNMSLVMEVMCQRTKIFLRFFVNHLGLAHYVENKTKYSFIYV
jgi:hypothetical protein